MIIATLETARYTFMAAGVDQADASQALRDTLVYVCKYDMTNNPGARKLLAWAHVEDQILFHELQPSEKGVYF